MPFQTNITFSPQLRAAIEAYRQATETAELAAAQHIRELGIPKEVSGDIRDFETMVPVTPDMTPDQIRACARQTVDDYYSPDPTKRKAVLDNMYDRAEAFHLEQLDLSLLRGEDHGVRGPDGLTPSERDFMQALKLQRNNQTLETKEFENQEYYDDRYSDPVRRANWIASTDLSTNMIAYIGGVLQMNRYADNLGPMGQAQRAFDDPRLTVQPEAALSFANVQQALQNGTEPAPFHFSVDSRLEASSLFHARNLTPEQQQNVNLQATIHYSILVGQLLASKGMKELMKGSDLEPMDIVFIDGVSLRDHVAAKYPDLPLHNVYDQGMAEAMKALVSGTQHVDLAMPYRANDGRMKQKVVSMQADFHALDQAEKEREHSWFRRTLFDWGPFKIQTRADLADQMYRTETQQDRDTRAQRIATSIADRKDHLDQARLTTETVKDRTLTGMNELHKSKEPLSDIRFIENHKQEMTRTTLTAFLANPEHLEHPESFDISNYSDTKLATEVAVQDLRLLHGTVSPVVTPPEGYKAPATREEAMERIQNLDRQLLLSDLHEEAMGLVQAVGSQTLDRTRPFPEIKGQAAAISAYIDTIQKIIPPTPTTSHLDADLGISRENLDRVVQDERTEQLAPNERLGDNIERYFTKAKDSVESIVKTHPAFAELPTEERCKALRDERAALVQDYRAFGKTERLRRLSETTGLQMPNSTKLTEESSHKMDPPQMNSPVHKSPKK